jgi:hypothetical protein
MSAKFTTTTAAKIPRIMTTIRISTNVNARLTEPMRTFLRRGAVRDYFGHPPARP